MAHFIECVRTRTQPVPGPAEGQVVLEIVDAAYESARTGQAVLL
jgi:predicted dehydrogenase